LYAHTFLTFELLTVCYDWKKTNRKKQKVNAVVKGTGERFVNFLLNSVRMTWLYFVTVQGKPD